MVPHQLWNIRISICKIRLRRSVQVFPLSPPRIVCAWLAAAPAVYYRRVLESARERARISRERKRVCMCVFVILQVRTYEEYVSWRPYRLSVCNLVRSVCVLRSLSPPSFHRSWSGGIERGGRNEWKKRQRGRGCVWKVERMSTDCARLREAAEGARPSIQNKGRSLAAHFYIHTYTHTDHTRKH